MSSLNGLPPLPKSLSSFNIADKSINKTGSKNVGKFSNSTSQKSGSSTSKGPSTQIAGSTSNVPNENLSVVQSSDLHSPSTDKFSSTLDARILILRREMFALRQMDLTLLSQLWALNESIQEFQQILQDQEENAALSQHSPSPSLSSDGDEFYSPSPIAKFRPAPPPPFPKRTNNSSSNNSSDYGAV